MILSYCVGMYMTTSSVNEYVVLAANEVFYKALSGGSIEGISVARAHDPNVTARAGSARQLEGRSRSTRSLNCPAR